MCVSIFGVLLKDYAGYAALSNDVSVMTRCRCVLELNCNHSTIVVMKHHPFLDL